AHGLPPPGCVLADGLAERGDRFHGAVLAASAAAELDRHGGLLAALIVQRDHAVDPEVLDLDARVPLVAVRGPDRLGCRGRLFGTGTQPGLRLRGQGNQLLQLHPIDESVDLSHGDAPGSPRCRAWSYGSRSAAVAGSLDPTTCRPSRPARTGRRLPARQGNACRTR